MWNIHLRTSEQERNTKTKRKVIEEDTKFKKRILKGNCGRYLGLTKEMSLDSMQHYNFIMKISNKNMKNGLIPIPWYISIIEEKSNNECEK